MHVLIVNENQQQTKSSYSSLVNESKDCVILFADLADLAWLEQNASQLSWKGFLIDLLHLCLCLCAGQCDRQLLH